MSNDSVHQRLTGRRVLGGAQVPKRCQTSGATHCSTSTRCQRLTHDLWVSLGNSNQCLSRSRRRTPSLFPFLERALRYAENCSKLGLRQPGSCPRIDNLVDLDMRYASCLSGIHFPDRLQQLLTKLFASRHRARFLTIGHARLPLELPSTSNRESMMCQPSRTS